MGKYLKKTAIFLVIGLAGIGLLVILFLLFVVLYVMFLDPERADFKNLGYVRDAGSKVGAFYLENKRLPENLAEVNIQEFHKPGGVRQKCRLIYTKLMGRNFTLVSKCEKNISYFFPSNWEYFKPSEGGFNCCFSLEGYKGEEFWTNNPPPFNSPEAWP